MQYAYIYIYIYIFILHTYAVLDILSPLSICTFDM